jgi:glutathione reductase (NADPH)
MDLIDHSTEVDDSNILVNSGISRRLAMILEKRSEDRDKQDRGKPQRSMTREFDVLVIGTGTAGYTLALACREAGRSVAVADNRPYGGTCAMRGCQPKKYLVAAAEVVELAHQMSAIGIHPVAGIDWPALMRSKTAFTSAVPGRTEHDFQEAGIEIFHGTSQFASPLEIRVGNDTPVRAEYIVIATGARPMPLGFDGEDLVMTSEDFLELPSVPLRVVFIGGGYISMEFAHVARATGAEVTVLQRGDRVLKNFEPEVVDQLMNAARDSGIRIVTNFQVCGVQRLKGSVAIHGNKDCAETYEADLAFHGAGRVANLDELNLDAGGIAHSLSGIIVNEFLQSVSNPIVYAIGDASATPLQLATTADMEAKIAAQNILHGNHQSADYAFVPSAVFTLPPLAGVGMTESQAIESGTRFHVNRGTMTGWASSRRIGQKHAFYKVLIEDGSGRILGAHLFGHNAAEAINIFALAMKSGLTTRDLQKVLWAYPTHISDIKYMLD